MPSPSTLSDALLRQLMAVGQVDVLVGLPTLDNAATIVDVVRAVHLCFTQHFPRLRTVMINSDGGSTDGTPELIRSASFAEGDRVQTSHSLRTFHRVVAPYHGLPGKLIALRTIFAAADLTQANVLVVVDPSGPTTTPERVTELIDPILHQGVEFLTPRYRRHPREGVLVTQFVRPVIRALYGVAVDEPLAPEFSCVGRFASHCLEQDAWSREAARFAVDLWLRTEAVAERLTMSQIWRPAPTLGTRTTLREAVRQVVLALFESLSAQQSFWLNTTDVRRLPTLGRDMMPIPDPAVWDYTTLAEQARHDIAEISPLLETILPNALVDQLRDERPHDAAQDDERWVEIVYRVLAATRSGAASLDHLADMFAPLYMWRASAFMSSTERDSLDEVQVKLDALCETFERRKPFLVSSWSKYV